MRKGVFNTFSDLQKNSPKQLDGMWKTINGITKDKAKVNADLTKVGADIMHGHWSNLGKDMNKTTTDMWNGIKNAFKGAFDWLDKLTGGKLTDIWNWFKNIAKSINDTVGGMWKAVKDSFNSSLKWVSDIWNKSWGAIFDFGKGIWNCISDFVGKFWGGMKSVFKSSGDDITNIWKNTWNAVSKFFGDIWKGIKKMAGEGVNGIVGVLNGGIGGINSVISTFGGKKETIGKISPVKFATGTNNGALEHHTYAMLNDGHDSPETNNREMAILPTGQAFIPQERNWTGVLPKGTEILNATETKNVMNMNNITHFANGQHSDNLIDKFTSGIGNVVDTVKNVGGSVWGTIKDFGKNLEQGFKMATDIASDPGKYIKDLIKTPSAKGTVMQSLGLGMFDKAKDSATDFWNTTWSEIGGLMSGGTASGAQGDFLKWAEKNLTGHPYVLGGFDCSEMVKEALAHVGVNAGRDTVAQEHSGKFNRISKEEAKPGDLVYFGSSGAYAHTGIYTGPGKFFNQHPSDNGPGGANISAISAAEAADGPARYYHVKGLSAEDDKPKTTSDSGLVKHVHNMLDNNMFKWIKDNFSQFFESNDGDADGTSIAPAGDHKNWLKQAGIPESQFDMYNYIVSHESSWNPHAKNPGSDAYGIPQALPGSKMASSGKDWHDNPITQLKWMKGYVKERYGGIKGAYDFWRSHHWYANGGIVNNEQIAHIAEGNNQEAIIPIGDKAKRPRAFELLKETFKLLKPTKQEKYDVIGGDDSHKDNPPNPNLGNSDSDDNTGSSSLFGGSLGKNIFNNKRSGNVSVTMNPTINISLSGNSDESIKDQVEKGVRQGMEQLLDELGPKLGVEF